MVVLQAGPHQYMAWIQSLMQVQEGDNQPAVPTVLKASSCSNSSMCSMPYQIWFLQVLTMDLDTMLGTPAFSPGRTHSV